MLISYIFEVSQWRKEKSNSWCPNNVVHKPVITQLACQALCEATTRLNCVGIAYSQRTTKGKECYLCKNDALSYSGNGEGFYGRRPGIFYTVSTRSS